MIQLRKYDSTPKNTIRLRKYDSTPKKNTDGRTHTRNSENTDGRTHTERTQIREEGANHSSRRRGESQFAIRGIRGRTGEAGDLCARIVFHAVFAAFLNLTLFSLYRWPQESHGAGRLPGLGQKQEP
jgi:hypothetical protein